MRPIRANSPLAAAAEPALVALAITGDGPAFEELVRRRQGMIRKLMRQLSGDTAMADDLAQEVFLLAWRKLRTLKAPGAFGGWLRRIAVNTFLQHIRRKGLVVQDTDTEKENPGVDREDTTVQMDLMNALARLKPAERLCVTLSYSERMSHGEICSATGIPLGTVKSHITRGVKQLRHYLKDYEEAVP